MKQVTIYLCLCGELPQFGWHDLYGYNLHCRECKRHTDWCVDKEAAGMAWNALIAADSRAGEEISQQPKPKMPLPDAVLAHLKKLWGDIHITTEVTQAVEETIEFIEAWQREGLATSAGAGSLQLPVDCRVCPFDKICILNSPKDERCQAAWRQLRADA